jgi:hypothetical protein
MAVNLADMQKYFEDLQETHKKMMVDVEESVGLDNIKLSDALKNQLKLQMRWDSLHKKVSYVYDMAQFLVEQAYADAVTTELKNSQRISSITEAKEFAKSNSDYKKCKRFMLIVQEVRDEIKVVVETVNSRKYILNNLTNAMIASVDETIL